MSLIRGAQPSRARRVGATDPPIPALRAMCCLIGITGAHAIPFLFRSRSSPIHADVGLQGFADLPFITTDAEAQDVDRSTTVPSKARICDSPAYGRATIVRTRH